MDNMSALILTCMSSSACRIDVFNHIILLDMLHEHVAENVMCSHFVRCSQPYLVNLIAFLKADVTIFLKKKSKASYELS